MCFDVLLDRVGDRNKFIPHQVVFELEIVCHVTHELGNSFDGTQSLGLGSSEHDSAAQIRFAA